MVKRKPEVAELDRRVLTRQAATQLPMKIPHRGRLKAKMALALAAAGVLGFCLYCAGWGTKRDRPREGGLASTAATAGPDRPALSPAVLLGLNPVLPSTAKALREESLAVCARLTSDLPRRPEAHAVAAFILESNGRTAEATESWKKALKINPRFASAYCQLGSLAVKAGKFDEATPLAREAIALEPMLARAYDLLVDALLHQGQAEGAVSVARQYVTRFPASANSHYWLGRASLGLGRYDEAKKSLEDAVRFDPTYTSAYYALITACERLGDREQARVYREKFAKQKEEEAAEDRRIARDYCDLPTQRRFAASNHLAAGNVHASFGDPRKAEAHWLRGAAIAPDLPDCRTALVSFYARRGRLAAALQQLDQLVTLAPSAQAYLRLSAARDKSGDRPGAIAAAARAMELEPDNPVAREVHRRLLDGQP